MPLASITAEAAFDNLQSNTASRWPNRLEGSNRIEPIAKPEFAPSFQMEAGEMVFTIGSCFARNVEMELANRGFSVPMRHIQMSEDLGSVDNNQQIFNNYGVTSIFNELQWALDPGSPFDGKTGFLELAPGRFVDLHLSQLARPVPREAVSLRRQRITEAMATATKCRVIIVTLGLVEVWWDSVAQRYLNVAPPKQFCRRHPDRFSLHVLGYSEIASYLHKIVELLQTYGYPGHKIILTVSPVPLGATFTPQDVAVANAYSKSVLRAAAEEITRSYNHIDYFPSYESVTLSERSAAWLDDMVHVTPKLVALNVARMIGAYVPSLESERSLASEAADAERSRQWQQAIELYREILKEEPESLQAGLGLARSLGAEGDHKSALAELGRLKIQKGRAAILRTKLQIFRMNNLRDEFVNLKVPPKMLQNIAVLASLAECAFEFGMLVHVKQYAEQLAKLETTSANGLMWAGRAALEEGDSAKAVRLLKAANEIMTQSLTCLLELGRAFIETGDLSSAKAAFQQACELTPDLPAAKRQLQRIGNLEKMAASGTEL